MLSLRRGKNIGDLTAKAKLRREDGGSGSYGHGRKDVMKTKMAN